MKTSEPTTLPCDIVRDLLPLYHDGVVSETTGQAVETHLEGCPPCRREYEDLCVDLPTGSSSEDPTLDAFIAMLKKLRQRRTRRAIKLTLLVCCLLVGLHILLFSIPLVEIPPEDFEIALAYRYEADGKEKFFVLFSTPSYLGKTSNISYDLGDDPSTFVFQQKKALLAWKVTENDYPWLPDPYRYTERHTFAADDFGIDCSTIQINDKVIWTEEANGNDPVPDYVYAYEEACDNNQVHFFANLNDKKVGLWYDDEREVIWDLDGNLLFDGYPDAEGNYPDLP